MARTMKTGRKKKAKWAKSNQQSTADNKKDAEKVDAQTSESKGDKISLLCLILDIITVEPVLAATCIERPPLQKGQL